MKEALRKLVKEIVKDKLPVNTSWAVVTEIDKPKKTITAKSLTGGLDYYNVIIGISPDVGFTVYPAKDSKVLIGFINQQTAAFVLYAEIIESFEIKIEELTFFFDKDGLKLNGDSLGGLIKINELKTQLDKNNKILTGFLNALTNPINEPGNGSPSAFQAALKAALSSMQIADFSNIENQIIQHGE